MRRGGPRLTDKVAFLSDPRSYPREGGPVESIETHFAWVFLTARHAYKLKKPLRHQQMDYRTLAARKRGCLEELRLNQRLAASVYEAVVPLTRRGGTLSIGGRGPVVDWLVRMKRLQDSRLLDRAMQVGPVGNEQMERVVRRLNRFYKEAPARPISPARYLERLRRQMQVNRRAIASYGRKLPQRLAQTVLDTQTGAIGRLGVELARRGSQVVEGHGDLRAEHVYLGPPVAIIDSLEFDPRLRRFDPAEEVALLALEIERLGCVPLAEYLVARFLKGAREPASAAVMAFYKSHRATTRAKLAAWHVGDAQFPDPRPWIARTRSFLEDALRYARSV